MLWDFTNLVAQHTNSKGNQISKTEDTKRSGKISPLSQFLDAAPLPAANPQTEVFKGTP